MATRVMALCLALSGLTVTAIAQTTPAPETWTPVGRMAQTITGRVTFRRSEITFQNGKSLPLAPGGQMLFRSSATALMAGRRHERMAGRTGRRLG